MPTYIQRLRSDGLENVDYTADNLKAASKYEPNGIYTVSNTYNITQTLMFDAHLDRLEDSAQRENIPLKLNRKVLKSTLRQMILFSGFDSDVKFRITVPRDKPDEMILTLEPFHPPDHLLIEQGTRCITSSAMARHNPAAKTTEWIHNRKVLEDAMPAGIYDTFLVSSEGDILEGLASNFYAILNGELRTAGEGVLAGISQKIVFEVCEGIIPLRKEAVKVDEIPKFSEAFLTSSSRGIIPVVEIDGISIGDGIVGHKTLELRRAYSVWMNEHLEEL